MVANLFWGTLCFCLVRTLGSVRSTLRGVTFSAAGVDKNLRNFSDGKLLGKRGNFESSIAASTILDFDVIAMLELRKV